MLQGCKTQKHAGADYAIGDVQGCYDGLLRLLDKINFNENSDRLWFVGDLVNRGPHSLEVLRFIKNLPIKPIITLGNHDLYLISMIFAKKKSLAKKDTLEMILNSPDVIELGDWLRCQNILYHCPYLNVVMSHAGIPPIWNLNQAKERATELEQSLSGDDCANFLTEMKGDNDTWSDSLIGNTRLQVICNYFTRMRFCSSFDGSLNLHYKGGIDNIPPLISPWFAVPNRVEIQEEIIFGHWAALLGINPSPKIHAIDTGFVWGGSLTALRLQDKMRISVNW